MKEYTSYEEIDRDLKILKLQNEIDKEEVKLSINQVKTEIAPKVLWENLSTAVKQKALEAKAMVKGAAEGFIEDFKEKNFDRHGAEYRDGVDLRVEPIEKEVESINTEIIVEKVDVKTKPDDLKRDRPFTP